MAVSLFDHERRLHDLEVGFRALLDLVIIETPASGISIEQAARTLHVRGEQGAARILMQGVERGSRVR